MLTLTKNVLKRGKITCEKSRKTLLLRLHKELIIKRVTLKIIAMRQKNFFSLFTAITMMFAFLLPGTALAQENADVFGLNDGYRNNTTM